MSRGVRSSCSLPRLEGRGPSGTIRVIAVLPWILPVGVLTSCEEGGTSDSGRVSEREVAAGPHGPSSDDVPKLRMEPVRYGPWRGATTRDFGVVRLVGNDPPLTHVFTLINDGEEPVSILDVSASCGCTAVAIENELVAPGHPLRISTSLRLSDSGRRRGRITVLTDHSESPLLRLSVTAVGRSVHGLAAVPSHRAVTGESSVTFGLHAVRDDGDEPPPGPRLVDAPRGCTLDTRPWSSIQQRCPERGLPSRWETTLVLPDPAACVAPDRPLTELRIAVDGLGEVTVSLRDGRAVSATTDAANADALPAGRRR